MKCLIKHKSARGIGDYFKDDKCDYKKVKTFENKDMDAAIKWLSE